MKKKWTQDQDRFLCSMEHAGQSWDEISVDFFKVFKIKRSCNALMQRFYKLKKKGNSER